MRNPLLVGQRDGIHYRSKQSDRFTFGKRPRVSGTAGSLNLLQVLTFEPL